MCEGFPKDLVRISLTFNRFPEVSAGSVMTFGRLASCLRVDVDVWFADVDVCFCNAVLDTHKRLQS